MPQLPFSHLTLVALRSDAEADNAPWPIADVPQWSFVPITGEATPDIVGLIMFELALQNEVPLHGAPDRIVADLAQMDVDMMTLAGGVSIIAADGTTINPGDGCGLEDWRDWLTYQADDFDVWMGEYPAPHVERLDDGTVRVWQVWQKEPDENALYVDIPEAAVMAALHRLDADLRSFRNRLKEWAIPLGDDLADQLTETFDEAF